MFLVLVWVWQPVELRVVGIVQDAGYPQMACRKQCCQNTEGTGLYVSSLVVLQGKNAYFFDATPDFPQQFNQLGPQFEVAGVFPTHAHIGHYTGLMYLGFESMSANQVPVYAMPRMKIYLENDGPWSQLVSKKNIVLQSLQDKVAVQVSPELIVTPFLVPHRDEYSETVGFWIQGPNKSALYLPDIDKWEKWETPVETWIAKVDYAFLDATFYDGDELPGRNMADIPHPFVSESMARFESMPKEEKAKVHFIHLNHTNPLLDPKSPQSQSVLKAGFKVARQTMVFIL